MDWVGALCLYVGETILEMASPCKALVVDDDEALRSVTAEVLIRDGWEVCQAASGAEIPGTLEGFNLVVLDQRLPDADGVELLQDLREQGYEGSAVVVTGYPTVQKATSALGSAATGYLSKPIEPEQLLRIGRQAKRGRNVTQDWRFLWKTIEQRYGFSNVLSRDDESRQCYITAACVADSRASVLVYGETGTGKEYLARAIHYMSGRRDGPFVALNCGAIPEPLVESELFGHEKGAFTSATSAKPGICEMANEGTLFLDEVGELTLAGQVKFLRFLQESTITRLGGLKPIDVDVRVIAATNRDLVRAMADGTFREDLYYRLAVVPLELPPLRERPRDIAMFAKHFLRQARREMGRGPEGLEDEAMAMLKAHSWPGNLRELNNVVQRAALLSRGKQVRAQHVQITTTALSDAGNDEKTGTDRQS